MDKEINNLDILEPTGLGDLSSKFRENGAKVGFSEQEQSTIDKALSTPAVDVDLNLGSKNVKVILKVQD